MSMNAPPGKSKLIKGATGEWEVVIGMEVHAQVTSRSKLFSGASTAFGGEPNSHVSLVDAAMPGMLPVINEECIKQAVRTGLGLKARINLKSVFDRKNYFYPDLPPGYQISQYKSPLVGEGEVIVDLPDGETVTVGIERLHLEQDAGKSLHDRHSSMSFVDLNRAGVALMEIVSKPDLRSSEEAKAYVAKLRTIVRYLGTCDGDMEKGNLRADVNVSVRKPGAPLATRCEIKNINSIRFIGQAIEHEARRQIELLEVGGQIEQKPGCSDPTKGKPPSSPNKERAHDYRYFPIPIFCRSSSRRLTSRISRRIFRNCRTRRRCVLCATAVSPATTPAFWLPRGRRPTSSRRLRRAATPRSPPTGSSTNSRAGSTKRAGTSPPRRWWRGSSARSST